MVARSHEGNFPSFAPLNIHHLRARYSEEQSTLFRAVAPLLPANRELKNQIDDSHAHVPV